jgi:hypothetical protein
VKTDFWFSACWGSYACTRRFRLRNFVKLRSIINNIITFIRTLGTKTVTTSTNNMYNQQCALQWFLLSCCIISRCVTLCTLPQWSVQDISASAFRLILMHACVQVICTNIFQILASELVSLINKCSAAACSNTTACLSDPYTQPYIVNPYSENRDLRVSLYGLITFAGAFWFAPRKFTGVYQSGSL